MLFPLPFSCLHEAYQPGYVDDHGNAVQGWSTPVAVACFWWTPKTDRQIGDESVSNEQASVDLKLAVDSSLPVDQRDRFTVDARSFEVAGLPVDSNHGPFGFTPKRQIIDLKWVG